MTCFREQSKPDIQNKTWHDDMTCFREQSKQIWNNQYGMHNTEKAYLREQSKPCNNTWYV